jgi:hypothetical protein
MQPAAHDDPEAPARRALARYRGFATALLVLMAALMLLSFYLPPGWQAELLQASAKAGLIGGIADWFAVTALFRHPLGLPIPHTAILPRQKERLGRALGRFIARYVVTEAEIGRILARLDIPGILHNFLADPVAARPAAEAIAATLPRLLATIEDGRARRLAARIIPRLLGGVGAGRIVGRALRGLVEGGRHQEVLGFVLVELKKALAGREDALRVAIEERVREQGGRLVGWAMGASIARRVLGTINAELDRMGPDGSEIRAAFDEWVRREIERIETDPQRAAEIGPERPRGATDRGRAGQSGRAAGPRPGSPGAGAARRRADAGPAAARRAGEPGGLHRRRDRRLGYRHPDRPAGTARRQGPAICQGQRHAGGVPDRRSALRRAAFRLWRGRLLGTCRATHPDAK